MHLSTQIVFAIGFASGAFAMFVAWIVAGIAIELRAEARQRKRFVADVAGFRRSIEREEASAYDRGHNRQNR